MTQPKTKSKITREEYNKILDSIEIQQIILKDAKLTVNPELIDFKKPPDVEVDLKEKLKTSIADKKLIASHYFAILAKIANKKDLAFKIECTFMCIFSYKIQPTREFLKEFEKRNLRIFTIPYLREFIQNMSLKMGLPPLVLPLYKKT